MKRLQEGPISQGNWEQQIIADLTFIKKHYRYPMRWKMFLPIIFWSVFVILIATLIISTITEVKGTRFFFGFVPLLLPVVMMIQYLRSLKFSKIETPVPLSENIQLVEDFLKANNLLIFRHPDAPELFQIVSKNISLGKEDKEMMLFIADDYRILVNSRFTQSGWGLSQGNSHINQMCENLLRFIHQKQAVNSHSLQRNF